MAQTRIRRKDLKQPDEFVHFGQTVLNWATTHRDRVIQVTIGIVVILVAVGVANAYRNANLRRANEVLAAGLSEIQNNRWDRAFPHLDKAASEWPRTNPGQLASLLAGQAELHLGRANDAASRLNAASAATRLAPYLEQQLLLAQALATERSGKAAEAAALAEKAAAISGPYTATSLYEAARLHRQAGNATKARELIEKLRQAHPTAPETEWAKKLAG
jgi:predicted negative regulator of RcsB-dependent stress response